MSGTDLLLAAETAYTQYGDDEEFYDLVYSREEFVFPPDFVPDWPKSVSEIQKKMPGLFARFWSPKTGIALGIEEE